jgi:LmbE family N-acetylglucosaminyl deacetylase|tara:strand:- start:506 stop:1189 length:684 start_codon:yes stop_codon:yes gene_type:complete
MNNFSNISNSKILVVAPHPDDEVLGCGGSIARFSSAGADVQIVIITMGTKEFFPQEMIDNIQKEANEAKKILKYKKLHILDGFLPAKMDTYPQSELNETFSLIIQKIKPNILFLPHRGDLHVDHKIIHDSFLVVSRPGSNENVPSKILAYETLSETEWGLSTFSPNVFINISDYITQKISAIKCYKSQLKDKPHTRSIESIKGLARFRGGTANITNAEAFQLIRHIY